MNLICLDSHYFIWGIIQRATLGQEEMIGKAQKFLAHLDELKAIIAVPTPIITELLMEAEPNERDDVLRVMKERFHIVEFPTLAAKNAADVWNAKKRQGVIEEIRRAGESMRTKIKVDTQILGVAPAANVTTLYTQDKNLAKLAEGLLIVKLMPEIDEQLSLPFDFDSSAY